MRSLSNAGLRQMSRLQKHGQIRRFGSKQAGMQLKKMPKYARPRTGTVGKRRRKRQRRQPKKENLHETKRQSYEMVRGGVRPAKTRQEVL